WLATPIPGPLGRDAIGEQSLHPDAEVTPWRKNPKPLSNCPSVPNPYRTLHALPPDPPPRTTPPALPPRRARGLRCHHPAHTTKLARHARPVGRLCGAASSDTRHRPAGRVLRARKAHH